MSTRLDRIRSDLDIAGMHLRAIRAQLEALRRRSRTSEAEIGVEEAAVALGTRQETLRRLLRRGDLIGVRYAGARGWRMRRAYVAYIAARWAGQGGAVRSPRRKRPRR